MGIRQVLLVVNKMDLVDYDRLAYQTISDEFQMFARSLPVDTITVIPTCAPQGENITMPATTKMPWYAGPTLLEALETADVRSDHKADFRLSVQRVCRPDESFRGYQGTVSGGSIAVGDSVCIAPSGEQAKVTGILTFSDQLDRAETGDAVTLTLDRNIDIARGDMITATDGKVTSVRQAEAKLVVLTAQSLDPAKRYWLKAGSRRQRVRIRPDSALNLADQTWSPANKLHQNAIAKAVLHFEEEAVFDLYTSNRATGSFILIDPDTLNTVAGGMVTGGLDQIVETATLQPKAEETVTLSLPVDLARQLIRSDLLSDRLDDVELVQVTQNRLSGIDHALLD
jgi:sulfate adenylyltransferase subunit 1